jgi:NTE family protein
MGGARGVKVGLVLGAGGTVGGAWLTGGLNALALETGWDPASAQNIVGTSAGAMMGGLLAAGVPPWFMVAHSAGETFAGVNDANGRPSAEADRSAGSGFRLHRGPPPIGPGSWSLIGRSLLAPRLHRPAAVGAAWLPRGVISTEPLKATIRRVVPSGWADHDNLWIVACDFATGRRVAFGRHDAPRADLADAVAASCAIPGFYRPVDIDGRRYVDGGVWSTSNLDIVRNAGLDLVICLNPTSSATTIRGATGPPAPGGRLAQGLRRQSGRRLGSEAARLRDAGTHVILIQPTPEDNTVMGDNLMSRHNRNLVIETATRTVADQLRKLPERQLLDALPAGDPERIRRPEGPPSEWPSDLLPLPAAG